jgi:hypothetical protein
MKLSYVLFASLATTAVASPQRLRNLQLDGIGDGLSKAGKDDGSMSMSADAASGDAAVEEDMSVGSKATKLFKPSPSKAGKASMPEEESSMGKSGKALSME